MLIPVLIVLVALGVATLYRYLDRLGDSHRLWRTAVLLGVSVGLCRALLASIGWYWVEHTGGPLQIPAYSLAMLAWPEAVLFGRQTGRVPATFYLALGMVLTLSSTLASCLVAAAVQNKSEPDRHG